MFIKYLNASFYTLLIIYIITFLISFSNVSYIVYLYEFNLIFIWIMGFELCKQFGKKYLFKNQKHFSYKYLKLIFIGFIARNIMYPFYIGLQSKNAANYDFKWSHIFFKPYLAKNFDILFQVLAISIVTILVFRLNISYKKRGLKIFAKVFKYITVSILIIGSIFTIYHYSTNDIYLKFDKEPKSFQELIAHQDLKGKYLYVDFWHSGCGPCIKDLKEYEKFYSNLPKSIKQNIAFVFIGVDRSKPGELTNQKYYIKKFNIDAKHYFISKPTLYNWWNELNPVKKTTPQFSYYYLINPKGEIELKNGPKIGKELKSLFIKKAI